MAHFKYLIIGGGMTADAAVRGIRELDADGSIGLIGEESDPPYNRPPLSKGLWKGKPVEKIFRKTADRAVELFLGRRVQQINPLEKSVLDNRNESFTYEKLLLATGGSPRKLQFGGDDINYFRTLKDYKNLRELNGQNKHFGVIGGGFIGSEITAALNKSGEKVTMVFPEIGIGARLFPEDLALFINDYYREKGVEVLAGKNVEDIQLQSGGYTLITNSDTQATVDHVVAGIGIIPNISLAKSAGILTEKGILVNEMLQTSNPDIYAAGDVAEIFQPALGKQVVVEHEDNANTMGQHAGRNMAGAGQKYDHLSYFYSDLFELGYEAVGTLDPRMEIYSDWQEPYKKGVVYYLAEGRVKGVLLWNVWGKIAEASDLIREAGPVKAADLKNRLGS
jgi:NADPH-dependent 2,4-dienoyl-CoA reductase/sulfur reductase-like enzyme